MGTICYMSPEMRAVNHKNVQPDTHSHNSKKSSSRTSNNYTTMPSVTSLSMSYIPCSHAICTIWESSKTSKNYTPIDIEPVLQKPKPAFSTKTNSKTPASFLKTKQSKTTIRKEKTICLKYPRKIGNPS